jgi:hypothetical protein
MYGEFRTNTELPVHTIHQYQCFVSVHCLLVNNCIDLTWRRCANFNLYPAVEFVLAVGGVKVFGGAGGMAAPGDKLGTQISTLSYIYIYILYIYLSSENIDNTEKNSKKFNK